TMPVAVSDVRLDVVIGRTPGEHHEFLPPVTCTVFDTDLVGAARLNDANGRVLTELGKDSPCISTTYREGRREVDEVVTVGLQTLSDADPLELMTLDDEAEIIDNKRRGARVVDDQRKPDPRHAASEDAG